jgi:iron(III) transport system permease protein
MLTLRFLILLPLTIFVGGLTLIPLLSLLWNSFKPVRLGKMADFTLQNFTLQNYSNALIDPGTISMVGNSFAFATGSTLVALVLGGVVAFLVERTNIAFKKIAYTLMLIPLITPGVLKASAWVLLLNPNNGLLNQLWFSLGFKSYLFNDKSVLSMIWVQGISMIPITFLLLGAAFKMMDPALEEASYAAGAGKIGTLRRITIRLMVPAIAAVGLLNFTRALESFDIPLIMGLGAGYQMFSTAIYYALRILSPPGYGLALAYSVVLVAFATFGLLIYQRILNRGYRYRTITGKAFRPTLIDLARWKYALGMMVLSFSFIAFLLPVLVLLWASLLPYYQLPSTEALSLLTLENYIVLPKKRIFMSALTNSVKLGVVVSVGGMILAVLISWTVLKLRPRGNQILDFLSFVSYGIPGVVAGFGFMIIFLSFPNPLYGTIWLVGLAYCINLLPVATRFSHTGIIQMHQELEEAAATCGAGFVTTLRTITMPIILPYFAAGGLFLFLLTMRLLSLVAVLYTADSIVFPVLIVQLHDTGFIPQLSALGIMMIVVLSLLTLAVRKLVQDKVISG